MTTQSRIFDQGIGINRKDLQDMTKIAGSANNLKRMTLINSMPEWLQPSGTFGIGLQSAFMWAEQIVIKTKSLYTQEALDIVLHSPTGPKNGLVEVEIVNDYRRPVGTSLSINLLFDAKLFVGSFYLQPERSIRDWQMVNCDPLLDENFPAEAYKLMDHVMAGSSDAPVYFDFMFSSEKIQHERRNMKTPSEFFCETNCKFSATLDTNISQRNRLLYRGQSLTDVKGLPSFNFFNMAMNLPQVSRIK